MASVKRNIPAALPGCCNISTKKLVFEGFTTRQHFLCFGVERYFLT